MVDERSEIAAMCGGVAQLDVGPNTDVLDGCAKEIVSRCKKVGLILTGAGATFPYGKDPHDSNIRIAPSFPANSDLELAMKVFTCVVKLVSVKKYLAQMDSEAANS